MDNNIGSPGISMKFIEKITWLLVAIVIFSIIMVYCVDVATIEGHQLGIVHKWVGGVQDETLGDGLKVVFFGKIYPQSIGQEKITFSKESGHRGKEDGDASNEFGPIEVNCGDEGGQSSWVHISVLFQIKPDMIVKLWNDGLGDGRYQQVVLKREIIDAVNTNIRPKEALEVYSGQGFNDLQLAIEEALKKDDGLMYFDILQVTIYDISLNPEYEAEIEKKQLAKQKRLKAQQLALAAVEEAKQAKAEAQVMVEERRAAAEASQIEVTTAAEAQRDQRVFDAEAKMEQQKLQGEGERDKKLAEADGILALGLAEAEVEDKMKEAMYGDSAGVRRATVEVATALAQKLRGVLQGVNVLPASTLEVIMKEGGFVPDNLKSVSAESLTNDQTVTQTEK